MLELRELQERFSGAMLGAAERALVGVVRSDAIGASARLAVYRHHILATLAAVLESTYPVVARLVDPRFFRYAADRYIRRSPPTGPCLFEYGGTFGDFLAGFEPARHLSYLADVARLEWAMNVAFYARDEAPIARGTLSPGRAAALHPSVTLLHSPWPIDAIWRANQPGMDGGSVDLAAGEAYVQVWRAGDEVVFRRLSIGAFTLRAALERTGTLAAAAEAALAADACVDLAALVRELLDDEVLVEPRIGEPRA